jgi:hypothetical protein
MPMKDNGKMFVFMVSGSPTVTMEYGMPQIQSYNPTTYLSFEFQAITIQKSVHTLTTFLWKPQKWLVTGIRSPT